MKLLEYSHGFINLKQTSFFEVVVKKDHKGTLECWLESPGRDIFIFSVEQEEDARKFRDIFWSRIKTFILHDEEKMLNLTNVIHEIIPEFFKEQKNV